MIWTLGVLPVFLLAIGTPIFALFLIGAMLSFTSVLTVPPVALHQIVYGGMENYALLAVPFFVFAGELMGRAGIAERLIAWVLALVGRMPGGIGVATIGACTLIGAISGASTATVAVIGRSLYPGLARDYGPRFASGLVSTSGSIDIVIPPSIAMILYGAAAEESIPRLFAGGVLPGLLIAGMMCAYVIAHGARMPGSTRVGFRLDRFLRTTVDALPALLMPIFILAGIYFGWSSPTEAGGFACVYGILVGRFVYREMSWADVLDCATRSAILTAQILIVVAAAAVFAWLLTVNGAPRALTAGLAALDLPPWAFLMMVNLLLLVVGCFLDPTSAIVVLTPLLVPLVKSLGIDTVHFGIVMTVNVAIGMFTPPFGLNLFVARSVLGVPLETLYRGVVPFALVQLAALMIITYWPALTLLLARAI
ncbi:TRAP transporter large permease [Rhodoplanes sp. TEM]|uniref:TRAP transporter large permease protein n=1 Tax=Rhodoplanes tepidamans TaxID=200616 RepID=A0ABT5JCM2_RHOTP|nr:MULTISPECIES: TRAP transporter large permease [Rhodoplanes]MDC7787450.1 TRAP transporter large permease [Rhodoplanes tepidamans]MDC7986359.1 TRAP transporter large permease [Rhodoplanes sp. TEM]MDQ0358064.1 C4-dicarboxylate transporter DctM subunit [Rhodoplanes tepidamans]